MERKKVLYISQEIAPYLPETPLSQLCRLMPQRIQEHGYEVRTFMPKYGCINERRNQLHEVIRLSGMNIVIDDTDHPLIIKVATLQPARMQVYFIDNEDYFHHSPTKALELTAFPDDNDERMMFFVKGVIETVKKLRWVPSVIHASGWISALMPLYLKKMFSEDPTFASTKIVYTLRDEDFKGTLDERFIEKLSMCGFDSDDLDVLGNGAVDFIKLTKLAIKYSDAIMMSAEQLPREIIDYCQECGHPMLTRLDSEEGFDACVDFYEKLISEK